MTFEVQESESDNSTSEINSSLEDAVTDITKNFSLIDDIPDDNETNYKDSCMAINFLLNSDEISNSNRTKYGAYMQQTIVDDNGMLIFSRLVDRRKNHEAYTSAKLDRKSNQNSTKDQVIHSNFKNSISSEVAHANSNWSNTNQQLKTREQH